MIIAQILATLLLIVAGLLIGLVFVDGLEYELQSSTVFKKYTNKILTLFGILYIAILTLIIYFGIWYK